MFSDGSSLFGTIIVKCSLYTSPNSSKNESLSRSNSFWETKYPREASILETVFRILNSFVLLSCCIIFAYLLICLFVYLLLLLLFLLCVFAASRQFYNLTTLFFSLWILFLSQTLFGKEICPLFFRIRQLLDDDRFYTASSVSVCVCSYASCKIEWRSGVVFNGEEEEPEAAAKK